MRAYSASNEEALLARDLLKDWTGEGFLNGEQYSRMEQETPCELRRTNIFLRVVLFLFTLIIVGAAAGLFFTVFLSRPSQQTTGILLLIFAAICYASAEFTVSRFLLYRYGIEEALAACSVGFLCAGIFGIFFSGHLRSPKPDGTVFLVPAAGAVFSLWIWRRFGLPYAILAAMVFVVWLPGYWTSSHSARHLIIAAFYVIGLMIVVAVRSRHRFSYLDHGYSIAEALLWLGIYLALNLQLSRVDLLLLWRGGFSATSEFSPAFYWTTWVFTWCLPPAVIWRGLRRKDRLVMAVGVATAVLTLVTNKKYFGWHWHTWDPMLLGALLIGVAISLHRWLAAGPGGIRHGFTAQRLSAKDRKWLNAGSAAFGLMSPHATQTQSPEVRFGGGDSGGGGATSDF